jgi:hypothetical protein
MTWKIETLNNSVDKELEALPEDMQARFFWVGELIRSRGLEKVGEHYVKHLQGGFLNLALWFTMFFRLHFVWLAPKHLKKQSIQCSVHLWQGGLLF